MSTEFTTMVRAEFRVTAQRSLARLESRSGAGVHAVRTTSGQAAYLKVTPTTLGPQALAAARRELRFYKDLAPITTVRTPRLLDCMDTAHGVAMLLEAAGEHLEPASWTPRMWANLGRELAALHNTSLPAGSDWSRPDELQDALADPQLDELKTFWAATLPQLADLVSRRAELEDQIRAIRPVFIHGDCHTGNIVHAPSSLVFCDWQSSGVGRPASDLAFLSVRATPAGTAIPQALVDAYLESRPCERRTLERALLAEELAIFVFLWPPYAAFNDALGIGRVRQRTLELAEQWVSDPSPSLGP